MLEDPTKGEDKTKDPEGGEGADPKDPQTGATAGTEPPAGEGADPKDPSGSSMVNRSKYDADIRRRDKAIAELKKQLAELTEGKAAAGDETAAFLLAWARLLSAAYIKNDTEMLAG